MRKQLPTLLLAALAIPIVVAAEPPRKVLVFDMEIVDTSGEGAHPDHPERLRRLTALLADGLRASGRYEVTTVRDTPVLAEVPASVQSCNGCERDLGRRAGADIVVTGVIHKISTLVLNQRIIMRDVHSGDIVASGLVDIRGDNERSWRHGVEWMLRHRLPTSVP